MELSKRSVLISALALGAILLGTVIMIGIIPKPTDKFSERLRPTGYVTVSQVRNAVEIFHYESHNQITKAGVDFIVNQLSGTPSSESARWIALTTNAITVDDNDLALRGEITSNGLQRTNGTLTYISGTDNNTDNYTITKTFTAGASFTGVRAAGLFTANTAGTPGSGGDDGTMVAENTFSPVNLAIGDRLTITWTIDLGLSGLD